jgi:hypothetical protein
MYPFSTSLSTIRRAARAGWRQACLGKFYTDYRPFPKEGAGKEYNEFLEPGSTGRRQDKWKR